MAQIVVRNLDDDVKVRLKVMAQRHGHSLEQEVRQILRTAAQGARKLETGLGSRIAARFAGCGFEFDIPEMRNQLARPAEFD